MSEKMKPRLKTRYDDEVRDKLKAEFAIENVMSIPKIDKVVLNMGVGEASKNIKLLEIFNESFQLDKQLSDSYFKFDT